MNLTATEKERLRDSLLKIQAVTETLSDVDPAKVPNFQAIQDCLEGADETLDHALRSSSSTPEPPGK